MVYLSGLEQGKVKTIQLNIMRNITTKLVLLLEVREGINWDGRKGLNNGNKFQIMLNVNAI